MKTADEVIMNTLISSSDSETAPIDAPPQVEGTDLTSPPSVGTN